MESSLAAVKPEEQRTDFIGRVQEQRQFLVALQGLLAHHRRWLNLTQEADRDFDPAQAPGDDSYANIFLPHGIGGIGKSWLTRRCLTLASEMPLAPPILTLYDDVSLGAPVLEPAHLLDRIYNQLVEAGYEAHLAPYWQAKVDTPDIIDYVTRYQFENREQWDKMMQIAADLVARSEPEPGYHSYSETSIAYIHASGAEAVGKDAATLAKAYDLLLEQMQQQDKLKPTEAALFRNPPAAQAAHLIDALKQIAGERPLVIGLDNLEIVVSMESLIRDCLVLPTNHAPIMWILSGRYSLADERVVEINGEQQTYKGYRDLLGENPPVVWDMSIFGDADLRDYLQAEAERRRAPLIIDEEVIEAVKSTSSGVPLVVEMVADALFTMDRDEFLQDFALDDQSLLASDRLDKITGRFLRYCLTYPDDLERVQAMALLRKGADEEALAAVWNLQMDQPARNMIYLLRARYAFVLAEGLHDAVYEFVRRQLRTSWQHNEARERLGLRAVAHYRTMWEALDQSFDDPALRVRDPDWQQATRDLVNALLWSAPDEAVLFLLPRFVEGLGFDRPFSNGLLIQAEEFLFGSVFAFSTAYANLLHRMRVGMQDIDWFFEEPGEAMGAMVESLLQAPGLAPLHLSILHLWQGNWLVEGGRYDKGLAAYLQADQHRPEDAVGLGQQLSKAFYELSSRCFWPESAMETIPSELGLQAAQKAVELNPEGGRAWFNVGVGLDYLGQESESLSAYERAIEIEPQPRYYNNLGNVYGSLGHDNEAVNAYEQAVELDPTYAWPYHSLGQIYADRGDYEMALDFYQQAIDHHQSDKDRAVSWDDFGDIHAVLGNYEEAISAYQWAGILNPKYASPWYGLGNVYGVSGRHREAIDAYRRTILLDPTNARAYHNLGDIYVQQGEYEQAFTQYQQAVARHKNNQSKALALNGLGDVYVALDQYLNAIRSYRQALELDPEQARSWNSIGDVHRLSGDVEAAIKAFQQAVELDPEYTAPWNSLGNLYGALEQDDEAIGAYLRVIELEPDLAWPYNNLGFIYSRRGEHQRAMTLYKQSIERHEDDKSKAISWSNLGDVQVTQGNKQQAIEAYRWSTTLDPNHAWPHHKLGQVYEKQGAYDLACQHYLQAIERHTQAGGRAASWRNLAGIYHLLERYGEATDAYEKVIELDPEDVGSWNSLGDVHLAMARYQEATKAYRQAINLNSEYAWPYHNLGLISTDYGAHESALAFYQQAIERHLDDEARAISWNKLGDTYLALKNPVEASGAYQQAVKLSPDYAWPYHGLGTIHEARDESRTALNFYQQALKRYPKAQKKSQALSWNGLGHMYQALDRLDEALKAYRQASQLDSIYAAPWNGLGDIYSTLTEYDQAIKSYERAIELDSTKAGPLNSLGLIYETLGEYEPAVMYFQQAIERYSPEQIQGQATSWNHLGNAYQALAQTELAIEAYQQAIEFDDEYVAPWHSLGDIYRDLARYPEAIQAYHQTVKLDPTAAGPWNSLGDIYRSQERYEQAIEVYQHAIERDPNYAWPYHSLGLIDEKFEKYESAINFYEQALKCYPQEETEARALSWNGLGNVYRIQGRDPQAIEAYRQVIELFPTYAWSYHSLGLIHNRLGQYESAIIFYQQALDRQAAARNRAVVWNDLGNTYGFIRRWNDATDAYQQAIDLDSQYARPWFNLGNVYTGIGDYDEARRAYRRSIELETTYAWSYNNLGLVCKQSGEYKLAIGLYQQAVERHTNNQHRAISWNNLGDVYHTQKQYEEAIKAYQQAIELDPKYAYPWNGLADIYRAQGRAEGVVEAYQKAIEFEPNFAQPYHNLGQIYKDKGAYRQAITYYRQAIERHQRAQDKAVSWNGLGNVYRTLQRYDQAIDSYQKSIELNPDEAWAYHNLAFVYKDLGTYQQAITLYQRAIKRFEDSHHQAVSWNNLGNIYSILERSNDAIQAYLKAIVLDDSYALPWNSLGETYSRLNRPEQAIDAYQQAIQRDPKYVLAWNNLGDVYRSSERFEETIRAYKRAIELDPTFAWPYHSLGLIYEERGDFESAILYYQEAVERHKSGEQKAVLWDNIGGIYRVMDEGEKAIEAYRRATNNDPTYAAPWYSLGNIYAALERDEAAINAYRRSIEVSPVDPWPYHNLALVYEKIQRYDEAATSYQQAIERHTIDRNKAVSWDSLGNVYGDIGRHQEAVYAFQEALRLNPDYALPWNSLGDVYNALEDYPKAIEAYERAIELDPTYAWPYNNLGLVYESLQQYDLAISIFKEVIKIHANDRDRAVSWNSLGDIYGTLKRETEAITAYEAAISLDPDYTWPYNSLGTIYERRGQHDQADALYQQATRRYRQRSLV
jgi:superkiller protein 3